MSTTSSSPSCSRSATDATPYRWCTTEGVSTFETPGGHVPQGRAGRHPPAHGRGDARHRPLPAARPPAAAGEHPRRSGGERQRPLRRPRPVEERGDLRRRRAADVPGHGHRDREGQEGPVRVHRRRRRAGDRRKASTTPTSRATCATARWRRSRMYDEVNTGNNLPAEIKIAATDGDAYKFLFMAKGGGSANKSYLFQETKALLNKATLLPWIFDKIQTLGTAACPPYHLAIAIGGTSAEHALETAKLASARYLDSLPTEGSRARARLPRPRPRAGGADARPDDRHRRPVRRQVLLPRRAHRAPAAPRRELPGGDRRVVLGRPPGARQDHRRRRVPRAARARPGALPARHHRGRPRRQRRRPHRPQPPDDARSAPSCRKHPGPHAGDADRPDGRRPRHRPRQDQGTARRRRADAAVHAATTASTTPGRPRRPRATPRARSDPPPPVGWTPTSTSSRRPAARS